MTHYCSRISYTISVFSILVFLLFCVKRYHFILVLANSLKSIKALFLYACILVSGFFVLPYREFCSFPQDGSSWEFDARLCPRSVRSLFHNQLRQPALPVHSAASRAHRTSRPSRPLAARSSPSIPTGEAISAKNIFLLDHTDFDCSTIRHILDMTRIGISSLFHWALQNF